MGALWNQSGFKQTVLDSYSEGRSQGWHGPSTIGDSFDDSDLASLSRPSYVLHACSLTLYCIAGDGLDLARTLLRELYFLAQSRGLRCLLAGFDIRDPVAAAHDYAHVVYPSRRQNRNGRTEKISMNDLMDALSALTLPPFSPSSCGKLEGSVRAPASPIAGRL